MTEFQAGDIVECVSHAKFYNSHPRERRFYRLTRGNDHTVSVHGFVGTWDADGFRLAFRPPKGETWEPWNGGDTHPPVPWGLLAMRDGDLIGIDQQWHIRWDHTGWGGDIIAYRPLISADAGAGEVLGRKVEAELAVRDRIDLSKIKPGDEVTVRCIVRDIGWAVDHAGERADQCFKCDTVSTNPDEVIVFHDTIVSHAPAPPEPMKVGDRVRVSPNEKDAEIVGISGQWAWVLFDRRGNSMPVNALLSDLERAS